MKNILAVLLTLLLFCVPYALGLCVVHLAGLPQKEGFPIVYLFGVLFLACAVSTFYLMYRTYLWIRNIID